MKAADIRELSSAELVEKVDTLKQELFTLRIQQVTGQIENPMRLKEIRKTIARIKTILTERELKEKE